MAKFWTKQNNLLADQEMKSRWRQAYGLIKADLRRRLVLEGKPVTRGRALRLMLRPGAFCVVAYRINTWLYGGGYRVMARLGQDLQHMYTGIELHVGSVIGPGLVLGDCPGGGVQMNVIIGKNCTLLGASTITLDGRERGPSADDRIIIGDNCVIGVSTRILGAVAIADGTQIKPNSVVLRSSLKPGGILSGLPAHCRGEVPIDVMARWNPLKSVLLDLPAVMTAADTMSDTRREDPSAMPHLHDTAASHRRVRQTLSDTIGLVRADIAFRCHYENKRVTWGTALRMLMHPGVSSVVRYRFQCYFMSNRMGVLGRFLKFLNLILYGIEIDERARIGGGLYIAHAVSILIVGDVIIGERCALFHQNMISPSPFYEAGCAAGPTVIGNDVMFGGGACAFGNIQLGDGCRVGVNAAVDRSFPAGSVLFGVPARVVGKVREAA